MALKQTKTTEKFIEEAKKLNPGKPIIGETYGNYKVLEEDGWLIKTSFREI